MRIFEVMAAGGFLVTDRLSPQSGLDVLFRRGEDYVEYDGPDDLIAKLKHYLARPGECLKIARSGQASYLKGHSPAQRIRDLLDFAAGNAATSFTADRRACPGRDEFGQNLEARARLYEVMQSFAQQVEQISVVVDSAVGARCISDLVDLPRLKIHVAATAGELSSLEESLARLGVLGQINLFEGGGLRPCDVLVIDGHTLTAAGDAQ
jgi:Glycosyl transferases group 1